MRITVCGYFGAGNIGDELILASLRKILLKAFPNAEISVMGKGKLIVFGFRSFLRSIFNWARWREPVKLLRNTDLFVLGGGGLFTDEEGLFVSAFWALHGLFARLFRKPLVIIGVGIGKIRLWNIPLVKAVFKSAKFIFVRDQFSKNILDTWRIPALLMPDLAFFLEGPATEEKASDYIVISARPFIKNDENLYKKLAQFCDAIYLKYGLKTRFIPFQNGSQNDADILNKIFDQMMEKSAATVDPCYDHSGILKVISNARALVGMRLHAGILAMLCGVPFIPIAYMAKVTNLWKEFPEIHPIDLGNFRADQLIREFDRIWNYSREYRGKLKAIQITMTERTIKAEKQLIEKLREIQK